MLAFAYVILATVATAAPVLDAPLSTLRVAHQERGLLTFTFDPSKSVSESLQLQSTTYAGYKPGWLHSRGDNLYSVSRTYYPSNSSNSGGLFLFDTASDGGAAVQSLGSVSSHGLGGVFCDISRDGRTLSAANIDGSTVSIYPLLDSGNAIGDATFVFKYELARPGPGTGDSQIQSNPHQAAFDPSGKYLFVPDRGADRVYVYAVAGPDSVTRLDDIVLPPGTGPRHVVFSEASSNKTFMYLVSEIDNTVNVFSLDTPKAPGGSSSVVPALDITHIQVISTLGQGRDRTAPTNIDLASEIALSDDGRFLYVSNRNTVSRDSDTLATFSARPDDGNNHLVFQGLSPTYGKIPRHFSLSSDAENRYIAVANEASNDLQIIARNPKTGLPGRLLGNYTLGDFDETVTKGPMAVIWA
ncbi:Lactonase, 7-bladed beta-propeller-domain-containing protein [Xylariaceae sp. FL1019]|nr:Lactonase, 7-bladed beta-propeller-domain-containing protein [Xylariaceae sp. FL1019]